MNKQIKVYYEGVQIEESHINKIGLSVLELGLKVGDTFDILPFGSLEEEQTTPYRGEERIYHNKTIEIEYIKRTLVETWNSQVRVVIEIHLKSISL